MNKKSLVAFGAALALGALLGGTALGSAFAGSADGAPTAEATLTASAVAASDGEVTGVSGGAVVGDPSDPALALGELQGSGTVTINADGTATEVVMDADGKIVSTRQVPLGQEEALPTE